MISYIFTSVKRHKNIFLIQNLQPPDIYDRFNVPIFISFFTDLVFSFKKKKKKMLNPLT